MSFPLGRVSLRRDAVRWYERVASACEKSTETLSALDTGGHQLYEAYQASKAALTLIQQLRASETVPGAIEAAYVPILKDEYGLADADIASMVPSYYALRDTHLPALVSWVEANHAEVFPHRLVGGSLSAAPIPQALRDEVRPLLQAIADASS